MKKILLQAWLSRGWLACLLWPLSQVYGLLVSTRRHLYQAGVFKSTRIGVPVIVVGNVIAGGAGKTPLVIALVQHLQNQGLKVGVLSRGYKRTDTACREVLESTPISESGDEPALILRATGATVFVASRRAEAAMALIKAYPATQVLVCDDGLQHYALARDIEIAVFDDRGTGNGWLLPAGPLREPWPARLRGIDLVLHSGQNPAFEGFGASRRLSAYGVAANGTRVLLSGLQNKPLLALAAIARPQAFFDMLTARGLTLDQTISLPDHHDFSNYALPATGEVTVLCTEKDAVKLFGLKSMESVNLLAVPLEFSPEPAFMAAVDTLLAPLLSSRLISQLPSSHGHHGH